MRRRIIGIVVFTPFLVCFDWGVYAAIDNTCTYSSRIACLSVFGLGMVAITTGYILAEIVFYKQFQKVKHAHIKKKDDENSLYKRSSDVLWVFGRPVATAIGIALMGIAPIFVRNGFVVIGSGLFSGFALSMVVHAITNRLVPLDAEKE